MVEESTKKLGAELVAARTIMELQRRTQPVLMAGLDRNFRRLKQHPAT